MKKITQENIVGIILFCVFLAFAIASLDYGPRARLVPLPIAIASMVFVAVQLVLMNFSKTSLEVDAKEVFVKSSVKNIEKPKTEREKGGKEWVAILFVSGLYLLTWIFGIIPGIAIFIFWYFKFINKATFLSSIIWAIGTVVVIYIFFDLLLGRHFYQGILLNFLR